MGRESVINFRNETIRRLTYYYYWFIHILIYMTMYMMSMAILDIEVNRVLNTSCCMSKGLL